MVNILRSIAEFEKDKYRRIVHYCGNNETNTENWKLKLLKVFKQLNVLHNNIWRHQIYSWYAGKNFINHLFYKNTAIWSEVKKQTASWDI